MKVLMQDDVPNLFVELFPFWMQFIFFSFSNHQLQREMKKKKQMEIQ